VVDIARETSGGFVRGHFVMEEAADGRSPGQPGMGGGDGGGSSGGRGRRRRLVVEFQNENLLAYMLPEEAPSPLPSATPLQPPEGGAPSSATLQPPFSPPSATPSQPPEADAPTAAPSPTAVPVLPLACVPNLICSLETSSGCAVATEELRYGLRLALLALPAHELLRTPQALQVVGPAAFGYSGDAERGIGNVRSLGAAMRV
jgi:hypothetical protein